MKGFNEKVSIILPIYNKGMFLNKCIDSILNQTYRNIELICVDDNSSDNSLDIVKSYLGKDVRVQLIEQGRNIGAGACRNVGMSVADGEWLYFPDADDELDPTMIEKIVLAGNSNDAEIVICGSYQLDICTNRKSLCTYSLREEMLPEEGVFSIANLKGSVFKVFVGWAWDKLFRRSFIDSLGISFQEQRTTNDMFFVFAALIKAQRMVVVREPLYTQSRNDGTSLSNTRYKSWECGIHALKAVKDYLVQEDLYILLEKDFINYVIHYILWNLKSLPTRTQVEFYHYFMNEWLAEFRINQLQENDSTNVDEYRRICSVFKSSAIKVSVIVPVYNVEKYLYDALDSLINQSLKDIEIICVNDGSTDGSLAIIKSFAARDKRIKVIDGSNHGYGYAMNCGIDAAQGEYIGILEPDDYVSYDMYEKLYAMCKIHELDFVKSDFYRFTTANDGSITLKYVPLSKDKQAYNRIVNTSQSKECYFYVMNTWTGIYKRDFVLNNGIRHNETPGASYQDNGFWFQTFAYGKRVMFVDMPFYRNRRDNPNSSVYSKDKVYATMEEYAYIKNCLVKNDLFENIADVFLMKKFDNFVATLDRIVFDEALPYIEKSAQIFAKDLEHISSRYLSDDLRWNRLEKLVKEPLDYYAEIYCRRKNVLVAVEKERDMYKKEYSRVEKSISYKLGLTLTWPVRRLYHFFRK